MTFVSSLKSRTLERSSFIFLNVWIYYNKHMSLNNKAKLQVIIKRRQSFGNVKLCDGNTIPNHIIPHISLSWTDNSDTNNTLRGHCYSIPVKAEAKIGMIFFIFFSLFIQCINYL